MRIAGIFILVIGLFILTSCNINISKRIYSKGYYLSTKNSELKYTARNEFRKKDFKSDTLKKTSEAINDDYLIASVDSTNRFESMLKTNIKHNIELLNKIQHLDTNAFYKNLGTPDSLNRENSPPEKLDDDNPKKIETFSLVAFCMMAALYAAISIYAIIYTLGNPLYVQLGAYLMLGVLFVMPIETIVLALVGLRRLVKYRDSYRGKGFAIFGLLGGVLVFLSILGLIIAIILINT